MKLFRKLPKNDIVKKVLNEDTLCKAAEVYMLTKGNKISPADKLLIRQAIVNIKTMLAKTSVKEKAMRELSGILDKYGDVDPKGYLDKDPRD